MKPSKRDYIKSPKWIVHEIPPFSKNMTNLRKCLNGLYMNHR